MQYAIIYRGFRNGEHRVSLIGQDWTDKVAILDTQNLVCNWEDYPQYFVDNGIDYSSYGWKQVLDRQEMVNPVAGFSRVSATVFKLFVGKREYLLSFSGYEMRLDGQLVTYLKSLTAHVMFVVLVCVSIKGVVRFTILCDEYWNLWFDAEAGMLLCYSSGFCLDGEIYAGKGLLGSSLEKYKKLLGMLASSKILNTRRLL